ncbi:peptidase family M13 [Capnocytophaga sp. oral taxon 863 str. F0517]|uniref:M13 family metallopeptidase n=1 Tax=Capnocytophaga sp. oral taxon 863 TaxID=1227265 RepID=UPI00039762A9|nr:M13 family metallopeptidase [Capnocytophaga sp. oral taxon 863]ERI62839.1 peptidase family M13 [Capnocytophaga sp. oral taxon 863 str. F0517]
MNTKTTLWGCLSLLVACGHPAKETLSKVEEKGLDLSAMDTSVRPQDDFYNYVNGNWMKTAQIPSDKTSWGTYYMLDDLTEANCLSILDDLIQKDYPEGSEGQKIQTLYRQYVDWNTRNAQGLSPIEGQLAKINQINSLADLQKYLEEVTPSAGNPICAWSAYPDMKDSNTNVAYLDNFAIGMGSDYYQKENDSNREALQKYEAFVSQVFKSIGETAPEEKAKKQVAFEKSIAKLMLTNEQSRDPNLSYNPLTVEELGALVKNINLPQLLKNVGMGEGKVIVSELRLYKDYDKFINTNNLPLLRDYLKYMLVLSNITNLHEDLDRLSFEFYDQYLRGQKEQRAIQKRAFSLIDGSLGEAFGKLYVEKFFPKESKEQMLTLISYLRKSFAQHIKELTWMSEETKQKALTKLDKLHVKVGYPDNWEDYSKLTIDPKASLTENLQHLSQWYYQKSLNEVGKPVDKTKWGMTPQTVNAYYSPLYNEIVFPAAILQAPMFNPEADPAVNFGAIGGIIGHEMTHGFDDSGAQFDADGNLQDWWSATDKANFEKATQALAKQYDQYEPVKGIFVNGIFTNGENIADLGGANIAFDALQMYLKDHGEVAKISGLSQNERFFIAWATVWRSLTTDQNLTNQIKTDPHAPDYLRAFAPLTNVEAWYQTFGVKEGDKLYRKPQDRVKIW